jgi:hypothetical protein
MDIGQTTLVPEVDAHDPTASFFTGTRHKSTKQNIRRTDTVKTDATKTCVYCNEHHSPNNCTKICIHDSRIEIIKKKHLCFNCLGNHLVAKCVICRKTDGKPYNHHPPPLPKYSVDDDPPFSVT